MLTYPLLLTNVHVQTMDPARPRAGSVIIAGGRIVAIDQQAAAGARVMDCRGGMLLPGFVDPHVHLLAAAAAQRSVDCSPRAVRSIGAIQQAIARAADHLASAAGWIRAVGYDESALMEARHPTRWDLDAAVPNRPVRLLHRGGHAAVLNSRALALAGISIDSEEPPGGVIDRRAGDGEPTGLLIDMDAVIERAVPPLPEEELVQDMRALDGLLVSNGVTAVQDLTHRNNAERLDLLMRVSAMAGFRPHLLPTASPLGTASPFGTGGPVKLMLPEAAGIGAAERQHLAAAVIAAHTARRQVAIHAVTPDAVAAALHAIAAALSASPRAGHRHRIEHAAVCHPAQAERAARLDVIVVSNPVFLAERGRHYRGAVAAADLPHLYAVGALARAGVMVAAASDTPVAPPAPLTSIRAAVTRRDEHGVELPGEHADLGVALAAVTRAAAYSAFAEGSAGSIRLGAPADLVLLSRPPAAAGAPPEVWWTVIGGDIVYTGPGAPVWPAS